jgi:hypothetical protein
MKIGGFGLLEGFEDCRKGRRSIAIFSPVGDERQLDEFVGHVQKLGLDAKADFIFIIRPGLMPGKTGLSELRCREKVRLGTSGCFFAGQALSYRLGYETIVVADLDAFLDSGRTFDSMVRISGKRQCAFMPLSQSEGELPPGKVYGVPNQWGVFPREVFEKAGFAMPYTLRGGEDYEYAMRLTGRGLLRLFKGGSVSHPRAGFTIYHKMADGKKFYPYVTGLMRAMLFSAEYSKKGYVFFMAWHAYYSFFADALCDRALAAAVQNAHRLRGFASAPSRQPAFSIRKVREKAAIPPAGTYRVVFIPLSLARLLLLGRLDFATDEIVMECPKAALLFGLAKATMLLPLRLAQGALGALGWKRERESFPFPPMPSNVESVAGALLGELEP